MLHHSCGATPMEGISRCNLRPRRTKKANILNKWFIMFSKPRLWSAHRADKTSRKCFGPFGQRELLVTVWTAGVVLWCKLLAHLRDGGKDCPHQSNAHRPAVIISPEEHGISLGWFALNVSQPQTPSPQALVWGKTHAHTQSRQL